MLSRQVCKFVKHRPSPRKHAGLAKITCFREGFARLLRLQTLRESMAPMLFYVFIFFFLSGCGSPTATTVHGKSVEYWLEALHDSDARNRMKAVESLGNVGPDNTATVHALI